jgi:hypothetical protein
MVMVAPDDRAGAHIAAISATAARKPVRSIMVSATCLRLRQCGCVEVWVGEHLGAGGGVDCRRLARAHGALCRLLQGASVLTTATVSNGEGLALHSDRL